MVICIFVIILGAFAHLPNVLGRNRVKPYQRLEPRGLAQISAVEVVSDHFTTSNSNESDDIPSTSSFARLLR